MLDFYDRKIKSLEEIELLSSNLKEQGKTIVTINGSFDIVHFGHVHALNEAKQQGNILIVGLNSDISYSIYKDVRGALLDESSRATLLAAMEMVDYVVLFDEPNPIVFLEKIKPHTHCNGAAYGENCLESEILAKNGGKLYLIGEKFSTSSLIEKIVDRFGSNKIKAVFLDWDILVENNQLNTDIIDVMKYLKNLNYNFFIITNSDLVKDSNCTMEDFNVKWLEKLKDNGLDIKNISWCDHRSDEVCECRKPRFVLFHKNKKEFNINWSQSWNIGKKISDCQAGKLAGLRNILVGSVGNDGDYYNIPHIAEIKNIIRE